MGNQKPTVHRGSPGRPGCWSLLSCEWCDCRCWDTTEKINIPSPTLFFFISVMLLSKSSNDSSTWDILISWWGLFLILIQILGLYGKHSLTQWEWHLCQKKVDKIIFRKTVINWNQHVKHFFQEAAGVKTGVDYFNFYNFPKAAFSLQHEACRSVTAAHMWLLSS